MLEARKIKNRDEIECLRIACAIGDAMFEELRATLRYYRTFLRYYRTFSGGKASRQAEDDYKLSSTGSTG